MSPCVVRRIDRSAGRFASAFAAFGVATVHEAYNQRGLFGPELRPRVAGKSICGTAVTALTHAGDNLMLHAAVDVSQSGDVIVMATKSPSTDGVLGELIALQCKTRDLAGVVLDAGVRDLARIREMDFPVWSRGVSAAGTSKAASGWVNVPIVCAGAAVRPGDLVVADDDGVVVVRAEDAEAVLSACRSRQEKESASRARYARGEASMDVSNLRPVLERLGVRVVETAADAEFEGVR